MFIFFTNLDLFCIDNARVIYRKIRYIIADIRSRGTRCGTGVGCEDADTHQQLGLANTNTNFLVPLSGGKLRE